VVARERDIASGGATPIAVLAAHHQQLGALHQTFLRQQTDVHARFLRLLMPADSPGPTAALATGLDPAPPLSPTHTASLPERREPDDLRAPTPETAVAPLKGAPTGPRFDRRQLETLASGKISSVFGPLFERQDAFVRQVRMPEPPLLLADRVLGIEGTPGEMGRGVIWTQTDVTDDAWYLHEGRMPAGILVEAGQADLLLISWLGVDFLNQGERVYRLLGCDLQSHGELPRPGDTLTYEIHVDGHARQGDVRLFFFHYNCWVNGELRVTVRNAQAGFFTDTELLASAGILWDPEAAQPTAPARLDPPVVACVHDHFTASQISAFIEGGARECFGAGFERADTHTRTPAIQGGRMRLLDEVTHFDPDGGPWRRGYLRARLALAPDSWFFPGHFKDDPCMPGTLMFEGCLQAMAIYLTALGYTLDRDGWRFEPVQDHTFALRCRGQARPTNTELVYEVFVDEIVAGPTPTLYADLLGTVDGLKAFHCRRMGLRLVPAWPLDAGRLPTPLVNKSPTRASARVDGFDFDDRAILASAWGRPSEAFGELYRPFDGTRRVARLPGPPFQFMSRVSRVDGPIGGMKVGSVAEVEYDVPPDAWYFAENGAPVMPFVVLVEVALQPSGWLASYIGTVRTSDVDLMFRNLDGIGTARREVLPNVGRLVTTTRLDSLASAGGLIITGFDVVVRAGDACVFEMKSRFGFFTEEVMRQGGGIATSADERRRFGEAGVTFDLASREERYFGGDLRLAKDRLLMIDRVTGLWPAGGAAGLGRVRCDRNVDASDWVFKAHFFQDPVQPGSLGLEAMIQALQLLMIERGMGAGMASPRFEAIATGMPMTWKYRGQVVPENRIVTVDVALTAVGRDERGPFAVAEGSLWVDGKYIYHARELGMRIVEGE
jgi:3-hydroxymyristoyl/3-hydroxydecanoyl-(acyl carrier protein) dehydratase